MEDYRMKGADMGLFSSIGDLVGDVVKIAVAPVEIATDVVGGLVKPVANTVADAVKTIKDEVTDCLND
jgi:hypothetical protein